ncbi:hypothetical protein [Leptolyngbya sp. CCY15150]|uniref:hypothetical protein n=1 Tax=Leptolyngbya sp. CCY15150 TaxID=2767772 RepID=UPI001951091F|nr:hypothetical protein [Leptolyngbya sp. CCY15150]
MKKPGGETGEILKLLSVALTYHGDRSTVGYTDYQARLFSQRPMNIKPIGG